MQKTVKKLVVVISDVATNVVVERWQFDIECDKSHAEDRFDFSVVWEWECSLVCARKGPGFILHQPAQQPAAYVL